jgi:hypothetical protein
MLSAREASRRRTSLKSSIAAGHALQQQGPGGAAVNGQHQAQQQQQQQLQLAVADAGADGSSSQQQQVPGSSW